MDSESNKRESNSHRSACGRSLKIAIVTTLLVCITTLAVYSLYPTRGTLRNLFQPHGQSSSDVEQSSSALISVEPQLQPSEETVSLSYGPFNIKQATMMPEVVLQGIKKPCDDCSITAMRATLINSSSQLPLAPDTGIHLHHIIFFNDGVADLVCPEMGERFFGSGDVRWTLRWNSHGDYGYKVKAEDRWDTVVELMNDAEWEGEVEIQVLFEVDAGMSEVRPVWLDATGCGRSDVDVKSTTEPFEYTTPEWISSVSGTLLGVSQRLDFVCYPSLRVQNVDCSPSTQWWDRHDRLSERRSAVSLNTAIQLTDDQTAYICRWSV